MNITESKLSTFPVLLLFSIVITAILTTAFCSYFLVIDKSINNITFIVYLSIYLSMWILYFSSKSGPKLFRVSTLRRLLLSESKNWTNVDSKENHEIEELSMEKAKTSITATAMLVGVAFIGIIQAKNGFYGLIESHLSGEQLIWQQLILGSLAFCSSLALVCFIISVDALDCMFNEFKTEESENKFRRYLYKSTIQPRYVGLVCLLTSIIFLNASSSIVLGSLSIGLIISVGYKHWFPSPKITSEHWVESSGALSFWFRFIPLISIPIITNIFFS